VIAGHDVVIDACDDPATKFTLNRACVASGVTYCYGGVVRTGGQMLVVAPGRSACLACVFPEDEASSESEGCSSMGILAPVAGVIGSLQAHAALRCLTGDAAAVAGTMSIYELRGARWRSVAFERRRSCAVCGDAARPHEPRRFETCPS
jgi:molybdopterin/thiamine biosynthesis adenylyltransferase